MKNNMHFKKGFTLIEILVAAAIIAILATIGITSYQAAARNGRDAKRKSDLEQMRSALEIYKSDKGSYPVADSPCTVSTTLASYINPYPTDPKPATYQYCYVQSAGPLTTTYVICASLENGGAALPACTAATCNVGSSPAVCNYSVANP